MPSPLLPLLLGSVGCSTSIVRQVVEIGNQPRLGAVGQVAVGQQEHRRHEADGEADRLEDHVEAIGRRAGGEDRHGHSPLRPNMACSRSACSVLVGRPVLGPPRCTSMMTSGNSVMTARPIASDLRQMPGPLVAGHAHGAAERRRRWPCRWRRSRPRPAACARRSASVRQGDAGCRWPA